MAEHTPAPWSYSYDEERSEHTIYMDPTLEGKAVKRVSRFIEWDHGIYPEDGDGSDFREADANVRLIAAAPELLEAVEYALKFLESEPPPTPPEECESEYIEMHNRVRETAREAIAKARGEES